MAITITAFAPKGQADELMTWDADSQATMALTGSRYAELRALPE